MISVVQEGDFYSIAFPYDVNLVELIREIPGRVWDPNRKTWTIPKNKLGFFLNDIKGTFYEDQLFIQSEEDLNRNQTVESTDTSNLKSVDISNFTYRVGRGMKPFEHQIYSLKYEIERRSRGLNSGFILADEPGAGKTLEIINIALYNKEHYGSKHCLIICCVNGSKYNWQDDIKVHTQGEYEGYILGTRYMPKKRELNYIGSGKQKLEDLRLGHMYGDRRYPKLPYFLIMNIEAIRVKEGKTYAMVDEIIKYINRGDIDLIAIDEVHKNVSPSSVQGKQLLKIKKKQERCIEWIPMTGTPIVNSPLDVFLPLRLVDGHYSNSYYMWCQNYCVYGGYGNYEILGYKNISHMKEILQPNMLRRLKKDILDLPPKIRHIEYVENTLKQKQLYEKVQCQLLEKQADLAKMVNPLGQLLKLRQVNGSPELLDEEIKVDSSYLSKNAKMSRCIQLIDDIVSSGEKVVVYSNFLEPLRVLHKLIKDKYKTCVYTGTMDQAVREKHKYIFCHNPEYKVLLGTIGALGTAHTLTAARNIIFIDEPWNSATLEQAEDRCHRAGTTDIVNIYTIITTGTIDQKVHDIIYRKSGTANFIVDNELDFKNHPELVKMLIS